MWLALKLKIFKYKQFYKNYLIYPHFLYIKSYKLNYAIILLKFVCQYRIMISNGIAKKNKYFQYKSNKTYFFFKLTISFFKSSFLCHNSIVEPLSSSIEAFLG